MSATDVTENRERRFLGFGIFFTISKALKGIKLICSGVMWLRSRYDQDLRRIIEQTEKALEETKNIKEEIDILRIQFESAKKELRVAYDVFSSSTTNLKTLVVAAEDTARKKQTLQTSVQEDIQEYIGKDKRPTKPSGTEKVSETLETVGEFVWLSLDILKAFFDVIHVVDIAFTSDKIVTCVSNHFSLAAERAELRNAIQARNRMLEGKKHFEKLIEGITKANTLLYDETRKLVGHTNSLLQAFHIPCKTSVGAIHKDIAELVDHWKAFIEFGRLRQDSLLKMKTFEEFKVHMSEAGQLVFSSRALKETLLSHSTVDPDNVVKAMETAGFSFPYERWTKWRKEMLDRNCQCNADSKTSCLESWTRTCASFDEQTGQPRCVGPTDFQVDICKIDMTDITFFRTCEDKEKTFIGHCQNNKKKTTSDGKVAIREIGTDVMHRQCYKECKSVEGATGCQFDTKVCALDSQCRGACFAIMEPVQAKDSMETLQSICYVFPERGKALALFMIPFIRLSKLDRSQSLFYVVSKEKDPHS